MNQAAPLLSAVGSPSPLPMLGVHGPRPQLHAAASQASLRTDVASSLEYWPLLGDGPRWQITRLAGRLCAAGLAATSSARDFGSGVTAMASTSHALAASASHPPPRTIFAASSSAKTMTSVPVGATNRRTVIRLRMS